MLVEDRPGDDGEHRPHGRVVGQVQGEVEGVQPLVGVGPEHVRQPLGEPADGVAIGVGKARPLEDAENLAVVPGGEGHQPVDPGGLADPAVAAALGGDEVVPVARAVLFVVLAARLEQPAALVGAVAVDERLEVGVDEARPRRPEEVHVHRGHAGVGVGLADALDVLDCEREAVGELVGGERLHGLEVRLGEGDDVRVGAVGVEVGEGGGLAAAPAVDREVVGVGRGRVRDHVGTEETALVVAHDGLDVGVLRDGKGGVGDARGAAGQRVAADLDSLGDFLEVRKGTVEGRFVGGAFEVHGRTIVGWNLQGRGMRG